VGAATATTPITNQGFYTWTSASMITDVQDWLDNPATNFGWIVIGNETVTESAKRLDTRNNSDPNDRPQLTITYTPAQAAGACCTGGTCQVVTESDCTTLGGVYQGDGTSCAPNPCAEPFGACCFTDGTCTEDTESNCTTAGGLFQGDGSIRTPLLCPISLTPFIDPLPLPAVAQPTTGSPGGAATYDLAMRQVVQQRRSELPSTTVWGYGDGRRWRWQLDTRVHRCRTSRRAGDGPRFTAIK
jgi:hypothetical protein